MGPLIIQFFWHALLGWIKVNIIDGETRGSTVVAGCGGIFKNCRGFVKGCFSILLVNGFAFEAELLSCLTVIEKAKEMSWDFLWVEIDSIYVALLF